MIRFAPVTRRPLLQRDLDALFNRVFAHPANNENGATTWSPRMDVVEAEAGFTIEVDLPGLTKKDIEITFEGDVLTLRGARAGAEKNDGYVRRERWSGSFERTLRFDTDVDPQGIKATMTDGVLRIEVPRAESSKPVRISVS